jgi:ketosteroid isomerase-like protein
MTMDSNIPNNSSKSIEDRLRILEDREEIRQLLIEYGRALDQRDFGALSRLFSENAEYIGGGSLNAIKGPAAISKFVEEVFRKNPMGLRFPNFHLFANVTIQINGDEAYAKSKGFFVVPNEDDMPLAVMMATNDDVLVRDKGRWKFKRRIVHMEIPAPAPSV